MNNMKAVVFTCLGTLILLILNCCKFHAEQDISPIGEKVPSSNETVQNPKNDTNSQDLNVPVDSNAEEEISKEEAIVLPTVAPATPVSSSFILISPSDTVQSVLQSIKTSGLDPATDNSLNEEHNDSARLKSESQIDEVEFKTDSSTDDLPIPQPPKKIEDKVEQPFEAQKDIESLERNDPVVDIMKYHAKTVEENSGIKSPDHRDTIIKDELKHETTREDTGKSGDNVSKVTNKLAEEAEVTHSDVSIEKEVSDKGILESFKDWKEKHKTNGKKAVADKSVIKSPTKKRVNKKTNYASNECGAKVIASNNEAENIGAILNENRDLYMLNPCSCSIWFVVELCEKVRAETIEIANFELFSSTPEKFNVYFSTRYPTREWEFGGVFNGKAERVIQSFHMTEEYYAKFVKIEMLSHFGKEHYCPLSLVRVFGRSEVEELDDSEDSSHDHDGVTEDVVTSNGNEEGISDSLKTEEEKAGKNFLKSATDIVIGLVNKATKSFTGVDKKANDTNGAENNMQKEELSNSTVDNYVADTIQGNKVVEMEDLKVIQVVKENEEEPDRPSETDDKKRVGGNQGSGGENGPSSNLVILLEGDDSEEEAEAKHLSKNCIFHGEIEKKRCANPKMKYWIEHLFVHRMCPIVIKNNTKSINRTLDPEKNDFTEKKSYVDENSSFILKEMTSQKMEMLIKETLVETRSFASTPSKEINVSVNSSSHTSSASIHNSVADGEKRLQQEGNLSTATKAGTVPKTTDGGKVTELAQQLPEEVNIACEKRIPVHPDLSQLLEDAENVKAEKSAEESSKHAEKENGSSERKQEKTSGRNDKVIDEEKEENSDGSERKSKEKINENRHVDVLVINYDEQLGEGKAEATEQAKQMQKESIAQQVKPATLVVDNGEADVVGENKESAKVIQFFHVKKDPSEEAKADHDKLTGENLQEREELVTDEDNVKEETIGFKDSLSSEEQPITAVEVNKGAAEEIGANDANEKEQKITSDVTSLIEPSFSQPVTASLSSQKTNSDLNVGAFLVNVTGSENSELPVSPAPVSAESLQNEIPTIRATQVPVSEAYGSAERMSQDGSVDVKESFTAATERLEIPKKETADKVTQSESSVKIGSGSFGNNKESAILKLKSRVKELETNLSLSTQYLEEMSKRYGTALEEQQKQFKIKIHLLNVTIIRNKEIMEQQEKSLDELTKQVLFLSLQLSNLTDVTREQNLKMAERYAFTFLVEAFIIVILIWTCLRRPRDAHHQVEQRRHSAPSAYSHFNHGTHGTASVENENQVKDQRPSNGYFLNPENSASGNPAFISITKRRRPRKRSKNLDDSVFENLEPIHFTNNQETAMVSSTAGVLFSAGKGIFTGLTGAFSKQSKKQTASRQTRALVDVNRYEGIRFVGRSKSLQTVEEDEEFLPLTRHTSLDNMRSKKCNRMATKLSDNDKRRG